MKVLSYLILFIILVICLSMNNKKEKFFVDVNLPGKPEIISVEHIEPDSVKLKWRKSTTPVGLPITGYMVMLKKSDNSSKGVYLNFKSEGVDCENCEYVITNIPLVSDSYYTVGVLGINKNGAGIPARSEFKTKTKAILAKPSPSPSSPPSKNTNLDPYLNNMISRADGLYSFNKGVLDYPDTFEEDSKESLKTLNESVMQELQEGRINVHIGTV